MSFCAPSSASRCPARSFGTAITCASPGWLSGGTATLPKKLWRQASAGSRSTTATARSITDTLTRFWVRLVDHAVSARPEIVDFDEFLSAYPLLLDKNTPMRHWSREAMFAPEARAAWREPDLIALPF
jgi:hypothetical protein